MDVQRQVRVQAQVQEHGAGTCWFGACLHVTGDCVRVSVLTGHLLSSTILHKLQQSLKQKMEVCKCYHIMHSVTVPLHSAITFWVNFVIKGLTSWSHFWFLAQGHASYVGAVSHLCIPGFNKNNKQSNW